MHIKFQMTAYKMQQKQHKIATKSENLLLLYGEHEKESQLATARLAQESFLPCLVSLSGAVLPHRCEHCEALTPVKISSACFEQICRAGRHHWIYVSGLRKLSVWSCWLTSGILASSRHCIGRKGGHTWKREGISERDTTGSAWPACQLSPWPDT